MRVRTGAAWSARRSVQNGRGNVRTERFGGAIVARGAAISLDRRSQRPSPDGVSEAGSSVEAPSAGFVSASVEPAAAGAAFVFAPFALRR